VPRHSLLSATKHWQAYSGRGNADAMQNIVRFAVPCGFRNCRVDSSGFNREFLASSLPSYPGEQALGRSERSGSVPNELQYNQPTMGGECCCKSRVRCGGGEWSDGMATQVVVFVIQITAAILIRQLVGT